MKYQIVRWKTEIQRLLSLRRIKDLRLIIDVMFNNLEEKALAVPKAFFLYRLLESHGIENYLPSIKRKFCEIIEKVDGFHSHVPLKVFLELRSRKYFEIVFSTPHLINYYTNQVSMLSSVKIKEDWVRQCLIYRAPLTVYEEFVGLIDLNEVILKVLESDEILEDEAVFNSLNHLINNVRVVEIDFLRRLIKVRFGPDNYSIFEDDLFITEEEMNCHVRLSAKSNKMGFFCQIFNDPRSVYFNRIYSFIYPLAHDIDSLRVMFYAFINCGNEAERMKLMSTPSFIRILILNFSYDHLDVEYGVNDMAFINFVTPVSLVEPGFPYINIPVTLNVSEDSKYRDLFMNFLDKMWMKLDEEEANLMKFESFLKIYLRFIENNRESIVKYPGYHILKLFIESEQLRSMILGQQVLELCLSDKKWLSQLFTQSVMNLRNIIREPRVLYPIYFLFIEEQFRNYEAFNGDRRVGEMILGFDWGNVMWHRNEYAKLHDALVYWLKGLEGRSILQLSWTFILKMLEREFPAEMAEIRQQATQIQA